MPNLMRLISQKYAEACEQMHESDALMKIGKQVRRRKGEPKPKPINQEVLNWSWENLICSLKIYSLPLLMHPTENTVVDTNAQEISKKTPQRSLCGRRREFRIRVGQGGPQIGRNNEV